jgi:hypothetical protein
LGGGGVGGAGEVEGGGGQQEAANMETILDQKQTGIICSFSTLLSRDGREGKKRRGRETGEEKKKEGIGVWEKEREQKEEE